MRRGGIRFAGAVAVSAAALWLAARNAHIDDVRSAVGRANFVWLLAYPVICIGLNILRGEIWRRLLERRVTTPQAFWAYSVGFLANNVLPFRVGEAARVVVLSARCEVPVIDVAAAAGLERLLDMAVLSLMLLLVAPAVAHVSGLAGGGFIVVLLVAAAVLVVAMLARFRDRSSIVVQKATAWLSVRVRRIAVDRWTDLARSLSVLFTPSIGLPAAAMSMVVWIMTIVLQWLVLRAFQPRAGLADAAFMIAVVSLATALPAAPGFVGVYHWAGQQSLVAAFPHLYDASTALAAATVAHAASYATSTALGVIGVWYFGMPPSAVAGVFRKRDALDLSAEESDAADADSLAGIAN
jgi:glycosyltransferase 2 family protein